MKNLCLSLTATALLAGCSSLPSVEKTTAAALAVGCDAYLLKPINTRALSDRLTAVAERGDAVN